MFKCLTFALRRNPLVLRPDSRGKKVRIENCLPFAMEMRERRRRSSTGPSYEIHARLIPAYSSLSQSFLPRSPPSWCQLRQINVTGQCLRETRARCRYQDGLGDRAISNRRNWGTFLLIHF
ncbi:hypothetical protein ANTPLA_LOCUS8395 [Anthophora plagiata]